jgi:preprotein translocase subunit SecB
MTEQQQAPRFALRGQYVKDLSLENPHAPQSLLNMKQQPKVDLNIDVAAQKIQDNMYELSMQFNVRTSGERTLFIVDLTYAGIFAMENIPEDKIEPVLMIDCAFMLFPFARRVISDVTRDGGFPPLLLEPVDFYRLYQERHSEAQNDTSSSEIETAAQ